MCAKRTLAGTPRETDTVRDESATWPTKVARRGESNPNTSYNAISTAESPISCAGIATLLPFVWRELTNDFGEQAQGFGTASLFCLQSNEQARRS